jgi:hypothetical protein
MKKKWQNRLNVLLSIVSLWLAGCSSTKQAEIILMYGVPPEALKYGPPEIIALYGVQMPVIEELPQENTVIEEPKGQEAESAQ